ncbi:MAG: hypothetical protein HKP17_09170 [Ignavibacteriaceae bacterium]|nr:hypothetical protein [Ignavibacteriaceae bacterium]
MSGKATIMVIAGFSLLFMIVAKNFGDVSNRAVDNFVNYHKETVSHSIAVSGANLAANQIFLDPTWDDGFSNLSYQGGDLDVSLQIIDPYQNIRQVTAQGTFHGHSSTVKVKFAPSKFSKFAYYSVSEGGTIWWTGSDTVWGPFHTQDYMRVYRHPVFYGKATTKKKLIYYTSKKKDKPHFFGGYEQGVNLPLPTDAVDNFEPIADDDGLKFHGQDTVYLTFDHDTLKYRYTFGAQDTSIYLPSAAPNGLIFAKNCIVRMKGVAKGQYTIGCSSSGDPNKGTIYLDDDIVFDKDPRIHPTSSDLLGICAENSVYMTDNPPNHSDINIHASIYCEKGGFGAQNYASRPISGNINLLGGIIQHTRRAVGTFGSGGIKSGFAKRYRYDDRLRIASPPFFPGTGGFEIVSWYE